jgi:acyl-coenzyme A synthetase/AMP-(fatty) acid ligase
MNYKGIQINPSEIESVIENIEGVKFVAVVGILDPVVQNLATAVVVKRPGFEGLTEKQIVDIVAANLPEHKQVHGGVYFADQLPTTLSGKVKKREVIELIVERNLMKEAVDETNGVKIKISEEVDVKARSCCCFC